MNKYIISPNIDKSEIKQLFESANDEELQELEFIFGEDIHDYI